eukprot:762559-Hanusia_phi.AAC.11
MSRACCTSAAVCAETMSKRLQPCLTSTTLAGSVWNEESQWPGSSLQGDPTIFTTLAQSASDAAGDTGK